MERGGGSLSEKGWGEEGLGEWGREKGEGKGKGWEETALGAILSFHYKNGSVNKNLGGENNSLLLLDVMSNSLSKQGK